MTSINFQKQQTISIQLYSHSYRHFYLHTSTQYSTAGTLFLKSMLLVQENNGSENDKTINYLSILHRRQAVLKWLQNCQWQRTLVMFYILTSQWYNPQVLDFESVCTNYSLQCLQIERLKQNKQMIKEPQENVSKEETNNRTGRKIKA